MFHITAFYKFVPISCIATERDALDAFGKDHDLNGLVRIAPEGVNGTVGGSKNAIDALQQYLIDRFGAMEFKGSTCEHKPFKRWFVKEKSEIVTIGDEDIVPEEAKRHALTPEQWHELLLSEEDVVVLDTRNTFEVELGAFRDATHVDLTSFGEFPEKVQSSDIPKDKKVLMYCTGGIRCEKAEIAMRKAGYEHVYQLDGGILKYLEQYPDGLFDGECFVFDHRVAVNAQLQPSQRYILCPHCGDPGDQDLVCDECGATGKACVDCVGSIGSFCSQNCAYHWNRVNVQV